MVKASLPAVTVPLSVAELDTSSPLRVTVVVVCPTGNVAVVVDSPRELEEPA